MTRRRNDRRFALLAGSALALVFTLCWALQVAAWSVGKVEHSSHRVLSGPVDELVVEAHDGDVTIVRSVDDKIRVDGRSRGTLHSPAPTIEGAGSRLRVAADCPVWGLGECASEITVQVPAGTAVRVQAASSDIDASALDGDVALETSSGDVTVRDLTGDVRLETASGDIEARGLGGGHTAAQTRSGDVDLRFASVPERVVAATSSGDARILVPPGGQAYDARVDTTSGDRLVGVRTDPESTNVLRASTVSGDATVDYGG